MLVAQIISKALRDANLQDDDPDLRVEARERLEEAVRKYSGIMGVSQDYIEVEAPSNDFTIGKPTCRKGKRLTYVEDTLPLLTDYANSGYVMDRDCIYKHDEDKFYKILYDDVYYWSPFTSLDYDEYFSVCPDTIVYDLDSVQAIIQEGNNLEMRPLVAYLRDSGEANVTATGESICRIRIRDNYVGKNLTIVYGQLVILVETANLTVTNDFLDLLITYTAYATAKTTGMKDALNAKLADIETKILDKNESENYLVVPDNWL